MVNYIMFILYVFIASEFGVVHNQVLGVFRRTYPDKMQPKRVVSCNDEGVVYYSTIYESQAIRNRNGGESYRIREDDITICWYTRNRQGVPLKVNSVIYLKDSKRYRTNRDNYFIIHGFQNDYSSPVNTRIKSAILRKRDCNIFVVDWGEIADGYKNNQLVTRYKEIFPQVPLVGEHVAKFIKLMIDEFRISPAKFKLIGHSLGAHVAGNAGAYVAKLDEEGRKVNYIIGLDPAAPGFIASMDLLRLKVGLMWSIINLSQLLKQRLNETNADFVQVIHTSGFPIKHSFGRYTGVGLGITESIGHADYYPNGGEDQPGCDLWAGYEVNPICAHSRAFEYYEQSILKGGLEATQCGTYNEYLFGKCENNNKSYLGRLNIDKTARGKYYFTTN